MLKSFWLRFFLKCLPASKVILVEFIYLEVLFYFGICFKEKKINPIIHFVGNQLQISFTISELINIGDIKRPQYLDVLCFSMKIFAPKTLNYEEHEKNKNKDALL